MVRGSLKEEKILKDLDALTAEASDFALRLTPHGESATLVALSGELGAGKTSFVKAAAKALGVENVVNSPTFVLLKMYMLSKGAFKKLAHIDAYRLEKGTDLSVLGFDELMKDATTLVMLEWPERVAELLPVPVACIMLEALPDGSRKIIYG